MKKAMSSAEILNRELEETEEQNGIFIPPYRAEQLMNTAHRVVKVITSSHTCMNYYETCLILRMAMAVVREASGRDMV